MRSFSVGRRSFANSFRRRTAAFWNRRRMSLRSQFAALVEQHQGQWSGNQQQVELPHQRSAPVPVRPSATCNWLMATSGCRRRGGTGRRVLGRFLALMVDLGSDDGRMLFAHRGSSRNLPRSASRLWRPNRGTRKSITHQASWGSPNLRVRRTFAVATAARCRGCARHSPAKLRWYVDDLVPRRDNPCTAGLVMRSPGLGRERWRVLFHHLAMATCRKYPARRRGMPATWGDQFVARCRGTTRKSAHLSLPAFARQAVHAAGIVASLVLVAGDALRLGDVGRVRVLLRESWQGMQGSPL